MCMLLPQQDFEHQSLQIRFSYCKWLTDSRSVKTTLKVVKTTFAVWSRKPLEVTKMFVSLDTVIIQVQKGNNIKEVKITKEDINKCLFYNTEKRNKFKCYLGKLLVNSHNIYLIEYYIGIKSHSHDGSGVKNPPANTGDGSIPGLGRSHTPWSNEACVPHY